VMQLHDWIALAIGAPIAIFAAWYSLRWNVSDELWLHRHGA
jgi:hypothetical protein